MADSLLPALELGTQFHIFSNTKKSRMPDILQQSGSGRILACLIPTWPLLKSIKENDPKVTENCRSGEGRVSRI
jgi:hypothetical protein